MRGGEYRVEYGYQRYERERTRLRMPEVQCMNMRGGGYKVEVQCMNMRGGGYKVEVQCMNMRGGGYKVEDTRGIRCSN